MSIVTVSHRTHNRQSISTIYFAMTEDNLRLQLQQPWIKVSTDAGGYDPVWGRPFGPVHPRGYGTYPRVLGRFVREQRVITLEDAVRKMTSAVADRLGLRRRGLLREGMFADVVVFDPETIMDHATFEDPHLLSQGVRYVWVNGRQVVCDGVQTWVPSTPIIDDRNDQGNYFPVSFSVPYHFYFTDDAGFYA